MAHQLQDTILEFFSNLWRTAWKEPKRQYRVLTVAALTMTVGLAATEVYAADNDPTPSSMKQAEQVEQRSADLKAPDTHRGAIKRSKYIEGSSAAVTEEDVGDVDSFGRNLRWLGVTQANVYLGRDCSWWGDTGCQLLNPAPALTTFAFNDLAHIKLPKNASNSMLCYWWSPFLTVSYSNPTAAPVVARLRYVPTLTVENHVLSDPALIDPNTGLPFGGRLQTSMTSSEWFEVPLPAGLGITERTRDSAACIAGLSHKSLVGIYGLTEAQATEFFKQETTVRINVTGLAQYVEDAVLIFGFRLIGD